MQMHCLYFKESKAKAVWEKVLGKIIEKKNAIRYVHTAHYIEFKLPIKMYKLYAIILNSLHYYFHILDALYFNK